MTKPENRDDSGSALSLAAFAAAAAHELATPLSSILGLSQLLLDGSAPDDATRREFLSIIHLQAAQLARIVQSLKDLALVEGGAPIPLDREMVPPGDLVADVAARFAPAAAQQKIALNITHSPLLPAIATDRGRLTQVLDNLVSNALKFTPDGGTVEITAERAKSLDFVRISVRDSGAGISPDALPHVFERFYRASPDGTPGTGLGLYLAGKLTAALGGRLEAESAPGSGSNFWLEIPVAIKGA